MEFKFKHIDDFEFIIPRDKQRMGNDFKALVDKFFPEDKDLIIALIELVSLSDIEAIGERYLYSEHVGEQAQKILETYENIVSQVQREKHLNIAYYVDWYNRQSYILKQSQSSTSFNFPRNRIDWEQAPSTQRKVQKRKETEFAYLKTDELNEDVIEEYLSFYGQLLHDKLEFKQYPHYCVIVRPISVSEGKETVPLGNIFLHFATMTEKSDEFYLKFINEFLLVWFRKNGVKIIKEIQHKAIEEHEGRKATKTYLPDFSKRNIQAHDRLSRIINKKDNYSLETYFDDAFSTSENIEEFKEKCIRLAEIAIEKFIKLERHCKGEPCDASTLKLNEIANCIGQDGNFWTKQGQAHLKMRYDLECFKRVMLRRELFKIGFLCFDINKDILVNLIANGEFDTRNTTPDSDYTAIWTEMFLPWPGKKEIKSEKLPNAKQSIKDSFSKLEQELFEEYEKLKNGSS